MSEGCQKWIGSGCLSVAFKIERWTASWTVYKKASVGFHYPPLVQRCSVLENDFDWLPNDLEILQVFVFQSNIVVLELIVLSRRVPIYSCASIDGIVVRKAQRANFFIEPVGEGDFAPYCADALR